MDNSIKIADKKAKKIFAKIVLTQAYFDKLKQSEYTHESILANNYNAVSFEILVLRNIR